MTLNKPAIGNPWILGRRALGLCAGALSLLAFSHCGKNPVETSKSGGGGSEAVALVGTFEYPDHKPAIAASVRLRPRLFLSDTANSAATAPGPGSVNAGTVIDAVTDDNGSFRMDSVRRGDYFLEIKDSASHGLLIPCTLTGESAEVKLGAAALQPTGSVTGSIVAPVGFAGRTYVQIYGLDRQVKTDSATGKFSLGNLPQGTYTLRAVYSAPAVDPREIDSVNSLSESTTDIGAVRLASFENENYAAWPMSRPIYLNTTAAGANVAGNVNDFPVLVRLNKGNFDFSQSVGQGRDIRFADAKGKRLRYEVERWDSAGAAAELWVRLDRVNGNSNSQFITMHWGLAGAEDITDSRLVFGADVGYAGVWHLNEDAADTLSADLYKDAVGYDPAADRVASPDRDGVIGHAASFNGNDYIVVPVANPFLQPEALVTVSAWVKASRTASLGSNLLSMGDAYNLRINPNGTGRFSFFDGANPRGVETPNSINLLDSAWHQLAGTFDGTTACVYVDGKLSGKAVMKASIDYRQSPAFIMGRHGNRKPGYDFYGGLDQVEVSADVARSTDWIKLNFENQRAGSKLTEFRP